MRSLGVHLRLATTVLEVIHKALRLNVPMYQTFLLHQGSGGYIHHTAWYIREYLLLRRRYFHNVYAHASYKINGALSLPCMKRLLMKELNLAQYLEFTHLVIHPGSAARTGSKDDGIDTLARLLNTIMRQSWDVSLVLENSAHGNLSIGGDLSDFQRLLSKLDKPDKLFFCIDTAHAYVYGYPIDTLEGSDLFMHLVAQEIGWSRVVLFHLNDTQELCGSKIDRHAIVGQGNLGKISLQRFLQHPLLAQKPFLMELPLLDEAQERAVLDDVASW